MSRRIWIFAGSCAIVLSCFGAVGYYANQHPELAANFADNVLRPRIGAERTEKLEAMLFRVNDTVDQQKYKYEPPPVDSYRAATAPSVRQLAAAPLQASFASGLSISGLPANTFALLSGENIWQNVGSAAAPNSLARTFVRPDPTRSYAIANLVAMNMSNLGLAAIAGTQHPGGELHEPGPGQVPDAVQRAGSLVAAFNGGFQEKDGHYGMIVGGTTYVPLQKYLATLIIPSSGPLRMEAYAGEPISDAAAIRQNGLLLVQHGQLQSKALAGDQLWAGATITGDFITWRSGIGLTANGTLIYAGGPSLSVGALAQALQSAGCQTAMELDVNDYWVRYYFYNQPDNASTALVAGMPNQGSAYLTGYQKDFFYVYTRNS